MGGRYRALRGDEPAIRKAFREDGRGLRNPVYFRFILTVDNPTAKRFQRLDGRLSERVLRDAVERTFRGTARGTHEYVLRDARLRNQLLSWLPPQDTVQVNVLRDVGWGGVTVFLSRASCTYLVLTARDGDPETR